MTLIDRAFIDAYQRRKAEQATAAAPTVPRKQRELEGGHPVQPPPHVTFAAPTRTASTNPTPTREPQPKSRAPLSHFTVGRRHTPHLWTPLVSLRSFAWPGTAIRLADESGDLLLDACLQGAGGVVALAGTQPGVGVTNSLLAIAKFAAGTGQRVAMIDAASPNPKLAESLGVLSGPTLVTAARNCRSVAEAALFSVRDNVSLLVTGPLEFGSEETEVVRRAVAEVAGHHDFVGIDLGRASAGGWPCLADDLVLLHRPTTGAALLNRAVSQATAAGYRVAGVIEVETSGG